MNLANAGARVTMVVRGDRLGPHDVGLPRRAGRAPSARSRCACAPRSRSCTPTVTASPPSRSPMRAARPSAAPPARCSSASVASRARAGPPAPASAPTAPATSSPAPTCWTPGRRPDGWPLDRDPLALETSVPGLFAAGDVRSGSTKRVAGAVGEGAMAVALVHRRLEELAIAAGRYHAARRHELAPSWRSTKCRMPPPRKYCHSFGCRCAPGPRTHAAGVLTRACAPLLQRARSKAPRR